MWRSGCSSRCSVPGFLQLFDGAEGSAFEALAGDNPEEDLHHVQPGTAGRGEMQGNARVFGQPVLHVLVLMGRVVFADDMQFNPGVGVGDPVAGQPHVSPVVSYDKNERVYNQPLPLLFQWRRRLENRAVSETSLRTYLDHALQELGIKDGGGSPMLYTFHDFRRIFITDAIMHGMPPHIAQFVAGHSDINTTMGYKAVYPEEVNGRREFIARRRALRPSQGYRTPTDEEWAEFIGHFEHWKVSIGDCGRSYDTPCIHEHSCLRCPLLRPDPTPDPVWHRSAITSLSASPKPSPTAGSEKPKASKSASQGPAPNLPKWTK